MTSASPVEPQYAPAHRADESRCEVARLAGEPMPVVGGYHHVHLISADPEGAARWLERFLGARVEGREEARGARNVILRIGEAALSVRTPRAVSIKRNGNETASGAPKKRKSARNAHIENSVKCVPR